MDDGELRDAFRARFGGDPRIARAPGRVNLIGEHTDYNDGYVLPVAIERATRVAFAPCDGTALRVHSVAYPGSPAALPLGRPDAVRRGGWSDYVEGVLRGLEGTGIRVPAARCLIDSDVPLGAGLSSSAALEVATALALLALAGERMRPDRIATLCQAAENEFVGTQCGIMDPFVSCGARRGHALLLDCRSRETTQVPLPGSVEIVVLDSGVRHDLTDGRYNERRAECDAAAAGLSGVFPGVASLRDVSAEQLARVQPSLSDVRYRRARHVVSENARVLAFVGALRDEDLGAMGRLLAASHQSLRDDFEVSCRELDALVELAADAPGVVGARMTGGGFGGSTVNLVRAGQGDAFARAVITAYAREFGADARVLRTGAAAGAHVDP